MPGADFPELDVDVNEHFTIADHGDIDTIPGYMEDSFAAITSNLKPFFASKESFESDLPSTPDGHFHSFVFQHILAIFSISQLF